LQYPIVSDPTPTFYYRFPRIKIVQNWYVYISYLIVPHFFSRPAITYSIHPS
jgi:hypothetical protein